MNKLFLSLLVALPLRGIAVPELSVGKAFPDFELGEVSGGEMKGVRSYLREKTVLHVFASW